MSRSRSLLAEFAVRRSATARAVRDTIVDQLPSYAALPASDRSGTLLDGIYLSISRAIELASRNEPNTDVDLDFFRLVGERRGYAGFPHSELTAAFDVGLVAALRSCWDLVDARNYHEMVHLMDWAAVEVPRAQQAALLGYSAARRRSGDVNVGHEVLVKGLLAGTATIADAAAVGLVLATNYLLVLCATPQPTLVSVERQLGIVRHLESLPGVLFQGGLGNMLILLPADHDIESARAVAAELVAFMAASTGQPVQAAQAHRPTLAEMGDAFEEARQVQTLVIAMPDAANRPYQLDELLVELAIARQPELTQRLAEQLAPLESGTDLPRTLEALFSCDLDREQTATTLRIHRRTLTYRLNRIREFTGIDPTTAHGIQLLRAMLTANRLVRSSGSAVAGTLAPGRSTDNVRPQAG